MSEPKRKGDWAQTYTGKKFWPFDPRADEVDIIDIAHSLALSCRFNGHCIEFYSVAQHSVLVSTLVKPFYAFAALLHDSTEAYLGDIIRPIKRDLPMIKEIEDNLEIVIFQHFGIEIYDSKAIKYADDLALYTELRDVMRKAPEPWGSYEKYVHLLPEQKIVPLNHKDSEILFLKRYEELAL